MSENKYTVTKRGDGLSPHELKEVDGEGVLKLCSCGETGKDDGSCDGTHLELQKFLESVEEEDKESKDGCCGGGCCSK